MKASDIVFNLDTERRKRGWTVEEFTRKCGISSRTWTNYNERPKTMPMGFVEKASDLMKLTDPELFRKKL